MMNHRIAAVLRFPRQHPLSTGLALILVVGLAMLTHGLLHLRGEVDRYQQYWNSLRTPSGGLRYVALGDSAAQGIGASSPEHSYVHLLAERLQLASGRPVEIINLSHSGARIQDVVRNQLPRLANLDADIVTVDIGGNDILDWNGAGFAKDAAMLCASLSPAHAVIVDVPSFMYGRWVQRSRKATEILTRECTAHGVTVAPLSVALASLGWYGMFTLYAADWFHPNDRGHRVWADVFWKAISQSKSLRSRVFLTPPSPAQTAGDQRIKTGERHAAAGGATEVIVDHLNAGKPVTSGDFNERGRVHTHIGHPR